MHNISISHLLARVPVEAVIWILGLIGLAFLNPYDDQAPSLCVFHILGFSSCPGCGLGHAISFLFHGDLHSSFAAHPLGLPALAILSTRILRLFINSIRGTRILHRV